MLFAQSESNCDATVPLFDSDFSPYCYIVLIDFFDCYFACNLFLADEYITISIFSFAVLTLYVYVVFIHLSTSFIQD